MNSKEYRKPEWVTRMEELQKKLSGETISILPKILANNNLNFFQNKSSLQSLSKRFMSKESRRVREPNLKQFLLAIQSQKSNGFMMEKSWKIPEQCKSGLRAPSQRLL